MNRPFVKVCGITRREDAAAAVQAGADAIGFVLVPESPRHIAPPDARDIASSLPDHVARVGVVVDLPVETVQKLVREIGLTAVQAHGSESPEVCRAFGVSVVKAFPVPAGFDLMTLAGYEEFPVLLDGHGGERRGGTGIPADWDKARAAGKAGYRVLLAGGLGEANLLEAVRMVNPVAVDLNSGVETEPGRKDVQKIRAAIDRLGSLSPVEEASWPW